MATTSDGDSPEPRERRTAAPNEILNEIIQDLEEFAKNRLNDEYYDDVTAFLLSCINSRDSDWTSPRVLSQRSILRALREWIQLRDPSSPSPQMWGRGQAPYKKVQL